MNLSVGKIKMEQKKFNECSHAIDTSAMDVSGDGEDWVIDGNCPNCGAVFSMSVEIEWRHEDMLNEDEEDDN